MLSIVYIELLVVCRDSIFTGLTPLILSDLIFPQLNPPLFPSCPYIQYGKQLGVSWISQHPIAFGRMVRQASAAPL